MKISNDIKYIGVNDHKIDLFEGMFEVPNGMAYNSYVIIDEKIAVLDTMDVRFTQEWLSNLDSELKGRNPDYLIVHHMEGDHSASIKVFAEKYPQAKIVSSLPAFNIMKNYFGNDFEDRRIVVKEGNTLELGKHTLNFIAAPLVHWPEVMMSYESSEKVLFSADGFGKFGANDVEEAWEDEARRYYFGIVGKFGANVQAVLKKAENLEIKAICSLHGPVLTENLGHYISLYDTWSSYRSESEGVVIAYTSIYGSTKKAALLLSDELKKKGCNVEVFDLARNSLSKALEGAFRYSKLVLATTTYYAGIFPAMHDFIIHLAEHNFQNRTVAMIENGSWGPMAAKGMTSLLEGCKDLKFLETVTLRGSVNDAAEAKIKELADLLK